jgi:hypothetical protein
MADDPRNTVTFFESEFPDWPIAIHYLLIQADNGAEDYFNVGVEIGRRYDVIPGSGPQEIAVLPPRRMDRRVLQHVHDRYSTYDRRARSILEGSRDPGVPSAPIVTDRPARRRREMTPERLAKLMDEYRQYKAADRAPIKELARDYGVNASTVSRWLAKARDLKGDKS